MHPITTSISWRDLPPEIRQRVICLTLNLGTSPLKQAWQQDRHKMADPKWKLRTYGDPDLGQYFHCPLLSPTPLHRLSKFSHQFNADLAASIPLMLRGMHARYDVLTQDQQANWSALLNSMKGWVDGDYNHPCNQYSGCSTQLEETDKMLKHMLDQVENNIDALKALECTIYRRKVC